MWLKRPSCSTAACASSRPMITRPSSRRPGMAHCYYHAISSVRKWGGTVHDYLPLHQWLDHSKALLAEPSHRPLRPPAAGSLTLAPLLGENHHTTNERAVPAA